MPQDGQRMVELRVPAPTRGFADGIDPALPDDEFPPVLSPDLENIRVSEGTWKTRAGISADTANFGGSGDVRFFGNLITSSGRWRLAARGNTNAAIFYDLEVGVDSAYQTTTGGTGLGGSTHPYFQGEQLNGRLYFTDRAGALRRYEPAPSAGNQVRSVALPAAPGTGPTIIPRPYRTLTTWNAAEVAAWTETNNALFDLVLTTTTDPSPLDGDSVRLDILSTSARGESIRRFGSQISDLASHTIAFYYRQEFAKTFVQFDLGLNTPGDYSQTLQPNVTDDWLPFFMPIQDLKQIFYRQFKCIKSPSVTEVYLSNIYLPGKLEGKYRWVYTHYDSTTGRESEPSPVSNSGVPADFSTTGVTNSTATARAFSKSCALIPTSDSGTDSTTNKIRIYRNGGVPSLTVDSRGQSIWLRTGEIKDLTLATAAAAAVGDTSIQMASNPTTAGFEAGMWVIFDPTNVGDQDLVLLTGVTATHLQFTQTPLKNDHANPVNVQVIFLDNVATEEINPLNRVDQERDDPPAAARFVAKAPDGRLWLFNFSGKPTGIAVSNRATPERPEDYEVFPDGVDPYTRKSLLQGWRFEINGDVNDEEIIWGGFYRGFAHVLTRRNLYRINAFSQLDWAPNAVEKLHSVGCISGDTVCEVNGVLYWVADGPRIVRWSGVEPPEVISHQRVSVTLNNAPVAYWGNWFARYHAKKEGHYYQLFMTPSGQTTNTLRLDWNADQQAFEPCVWYDSSGTRLAWRGGAVRDSGSDTHDFYQVTTTGLVFQSDTGSTDNSVAIKIRMKTKKFRLGYTSLVRYVYTRLAAVTDSVTLSVASGGSEYGDTTSTSTTLTLTGSGDKEIKSHIDRTVKGRWVQLTISGDVSNRPAFRDLEIHYIPIRAGRTSS
jgi:hypothetical protein